ncbi:MAG: terpene cyclase/mutase family protein [Anaerolineae bacterium]|nr:terpene cyclase/mutase family protein [Anaerolineae bacterium]MDH7475069.1 terpene cyclase/mutase family protein [Anaerolineae bacterium]
MKKLFCTLFVLATLLMAAIPTYAGAPEALAWLRAQQNPDGGFGSPASAAGTTADVVLAIVAAGEDPATWDKDGHTPLSYLAAHGSEVATSAGNTAKVIMALVAAGQNPRTFSTVDLVYSLERQLSSDGKFGGEAETLAGHCLAIMALQSVSRPIPATAVDWLKARQIEDGTWSWNGDTTPGSGDNNSTAYAVMALVAAGKSANDQAIAKAIAHFHSQQNDDGGFPYINPSEWGTDTDSNSTAVVIQALIAAGENPASAAWTRNGHTPLSALLALQNKSGAFAWQAAMPDDNLLSTIQAVPAIAGKAFPVAITTVSAEPVTLPTTGGVLFVPAGAVIGGGLALLAMGWTLRRYKL